MILISFQYLQGFTNKLIGSIYFMFELQILDYPGNCKINSYYISETKSLTNETFTTYVVNCSDKSDTYIGYQQL